MACTWAVSVCELQLFVNTVFIHFLSRVCPSHHCIRAEPIQGCDAEMEWALGKFRFHSLISIRFLGHYSSSNSSLNVSQWCHQLNKPKILVEIIPIFSWVKSTYTYRRAHLAMFSWVKVYIHSSTLSSLSPPFITLSFEGKAVVQWIASWTPLIGNPVGDPKQVTIFPTACKFVL